MERRVGPTGQVIYYSTEVQDLKITLVYNGTPLLESATLSSRQWNHFCDMIFSYGISVANEAEYKESMASHVEYLEKHNRLGNILEKGIVCEMPTMRFYDLLCSAISLIYFGFIPNDEMNGFIIQDSHNVFYGMEASDFKSELGLDNSDEDVLAKINFILDNPYICYGCKKRIEVSPMMCMCKKIPYCGKECQIADWKNHKKICPFSKSNKSKAAEKKPAEKKPAEKKPAEKQTC